MHSYTRIYMFYGISKIFRLMSLFSRIAIRIMWHNESDAFNRANLIKLYVHGTTH